MDLMSAYAESVLDGESVYQEDYEYEERARAVIGEAAERIERMGILSEEASSDGEGEVGEAAAAIAAQARVEALAELKEVAERLADASAERFAISMRKGRPTAGAARRISDRPERRFALRSSQTLLELETAGGLYDRLLEGRVYTRVVARTGIGKSRVFPAKTSLLGKRVLLLQPDLALGTSVRDGLENHTRVYHNTCERLRPDGRLTLMSYDDFVGAFRSFEGERILSTVDVIIMDEAHLPFSSVKFVMIAMATLGHPRCSLLVLTATDPEGGDVQVLNNTQVIGINSTITEMVDQGAFTDGPRAKDRTMLILPTDGLAMNVAKKLQLAGHESFLLDSATRPSEIAHIERQLQGESLGVRFLVTTEKYGTGHNFRVVDVYSDVARSEYYMNERHEVHSRIVPINRAEAKQHAGRTNRGLAEPGRFFQCTGYGEPVDSEEISASEQFRLYCQLRAAGIIPLDERTPPAGFVRFGIAPDVAADILSVGLPAEVAIRYFASDGKVPAAYAKGLEPFSESSKYFRISKHSEPLGAHSWPTVPLGGYFGTPVNDAVHVRVPFVSDDSELRAKMVAISAIAQGLFPLPAKVVTILDSDPDESDEEVTVKRGAIYLPRKIQAPPKGKSVVERAVDAWGFDITEEDQRSHRSAIYGESAFDPAVLKSLRDLTVLDEPVISVNDAGVKRGRRRVDILESAASDSPVEVSSASGIVLATIRRSSWEHMIKGDPLTPQEAVSLIRAMGKDPVRFARSTVFACWSNVWLSLLQTFADGEVLDAVQEKNVHVFLSSFLYAWYEVYRQGVDSVILNSYIKRGFWTRILAGGSFELEFNRARSKGKAEIVQSERFFRRINAIREGFAYTLAACERHGMFMPSTVNAVQAQLGIAKPTGVKFIDAPTNALARRFGAVARIGTSGDGKPPDGRRRVLPGGRTLEPDGSVKRLEYSGVDGGGGS